MSILNRLVSQIAMSILNRLVSQTSMSILNRLVSQIAMSILNRLVSQIAMSILNRLFSQTSMSILNRLVSQIAMSILNRLVSQTAMSIPNRPVGHIDCNVDSKQTSRHYVASFLSPIHARRVYPCFDEPAFKANFSISIIHPVGYSAFSNMDVVDQQTIPARTPDGEVWETTSFRTTPVMSTYLVAFVVCKFHSKTRVVRDGVEFRVWAREDVIDQAYFALDIGVRLFNILEDFSGFDYPLPKLDMVALPQLAVAGMENWGLVTYREEYMLYDERETPTETLQENTFIIAHELGHQWYSNLVTQVYWDELWLKECFATVMGKIALEHLFPDWAMWDEQFVVKELQMVMKLDSLVTSHPIQQPVTRVGDIMDNFDMISYQKSPAILRMLEHSIRYETFKEGLEVFLRNKQYGNADAWDIWRAITSVSINVLWIPLPFIHIQPDKKFANTQALRRSEPLKCTFVIIQVTKAHGQYRDISDLMAPWLGQMGYPVVTVSRDCGQDMVCLHQEHFLLDKGKAEVDESQYKYIWPIPVTFSSAASNDIVSPYTYWLNTRSGAFAIPNVQNDQWILVNVNRTGFYRTNYNTHNWRLLSRQLMEDHTIISPASRAALIDDVFSFATEGRLNLSIALDLTRYLERETDYVPWKGAIVTFEYIDRMLRTTPVYGIFKEYILHQARTVYDYVGWNNTGPHQEKLLRVVILQQMCAYGHESCIAKTKELFQNFSNGHAIPPDYRSFAYSTRVASGGADVWESTWDSYKQSSPGEAKHWLAALTATGEPWLINRLLSRTLDPEQLSLTDTVSVFQYVSGNPIGGYLAWNFFRDQWDLLKDRYGSGLFLMGDIITAVTEWFNTQYQLEELETFISSKKEDLDNLSGVSNFLQAVDNTKANIRWMENNYGQLEVWLEYWKTQKS
ncbi:thyrotropin-releasing hormone-degrading ectoenzyme [Strongylocentrotus purpuratus]|uniref:Aminopeptidase n=1 Tax=Strongylocentrotus purpuratus TaxID=7668 RepID=A0A7M7MZ66_STRPU|nr:thyrotropin-releasing hormone-degrading ectoenzyme [Strongylocentrotus purpuratus]